MGWSKYLADIWLLFRGLLYNIGLIGTRERRLRVHSTFACDEAFWLC